MFLCSHFPQTLAAYAPPRRTKSRGNMPLCGTDPVLKHQFDELTQNLAQSATRRAALKQFGVRLAGMALAWFGLAKFAQVGKAKTISCASEADCRSGQTGCENVCVALI